MRGHLARSGVAALPGAEKLPHPQARTGHLRQALRHTLQARARLHPLPEHAHRPASPPPPHRDHRQPRRADPGSPPQRMARRGGRTPGNGSRYDCEPRSGSGRRHVRRPAPAPHGTTGSRRPNRGAAPAVRVLLRLEISKAGYDRHDSWTDDNAQRWRNGCHASSATSRQSWLRRRKPGRKRNAGTRITSPNSGARKRSSDANGRQPSMRLARRRSRYYAARPSAPRTTPGSRLEKCVRSAMRSKAAPTDDDSTRVDDQAS
jgi:hypothetical protein